MIGKWKKTQLQLWYCYKFILIYIFYHSQADSVIVSQLFSMATCARYFKLGLKPG